MTKTGPKLRGISPSAMQSRQTHCIRGHEFSGDNLYVDPRGRRSCRLCHRNRERERKMRQRSGGM